MESSKVQPLAARIAAALITPVISGLGPMSLFSGHAPERWTRFGYIGPLSGDGAQGFGLAIFVFGLLPLAFFARSARQAGWFAGVVMALFWVALGRSLLSA